MAVRVLIVLAALAVLYGCGQASSPAEKQEKQEGVEDAGGGQSQENDKSGKILFLRDYNIYEMNADGTGVTTVIDDPFDITGAVMSPNGERIAFVINSQGGLDIYVINADGTGPKTRLFNDLSGGGDAAVDFAFSPDGNKMAVSASSGYGDLSGFSEGSLTDIYTIDLDGTDLTRLTNMKGEEYYPVWSRNGTKISFRTTDLVSTDRETMDSGGNPVEVQERIYGTYEMNADGTEVTTDSLSWASLIGLTWSPYCRKIAFFSPEVLAGGPLNRNVEGPLYVRNADGQEVQITHDRDDYVNSAVLSPDCTKIAFSGQSYNLNRVIVLNADGTGRKVRLAVRLDGDPTLGVRLIGWRSK